MAKNKIFTSDEIFHICKAFLLAGTDGDGYLSGEDLLSMNDEHALDKLDSLSKSAREKFMKQVDTSVLEQSKLFSDLPLQKPLFQHVRCMRIQLSPKSRFLFNSKLF